MIDIDVSKIVSEIGEPTARFIENEESKKQKKNIIIFSIVFLAIFIITPVLFLILSQVTKANAAKVSKDIATLTESNKKMLSVESLGQEIEKRNNSISSILKGNPNWSFVFDQLEKVIPTGITFSRFEADSATSLKLAGLSTDYPTLSKLVVAMQQMKDEEGGDKAGNIFSGVTLTNASLVTINEERYVDFVITFGVAKRFNREALNPITAVEKPVVKEEPKEEVIESETPAEESEQPAEETTPDAATPAETTPAPTDGASLPTL